MDGREARGRLYEAFARTSKAAVPRRCVELLEMMSQGGRTAGALARARRISVTSISGRLQVLARSRLVATRRDGTKVFCRLAGGEAAAFVVVLRDLARSGLPEVGQVVRGYFAARDALEPVSCEDLLARAGEGKPVILDLGLAQEFAAEHIPGALPVPPGQLGAALARLAEQAVIVACCQGLYCVLAPRAVQRVRGAGFRAGRLAGGFPQWRLAGLPAAAGEV